MLTELQWQKPKFIWSGKQILGVNNNPMERDERVEMWWVSLPQEMRSEAGKAKEKWEEYCEWTPEQQPEGVFHFEYESTQDQGSVGGEQNYRDKPKKLDKEKVKECKGDPTKTKGWPYPVDADGRVSKSIKPFKKANDYLEVVEDGRDTRAQKLRFYGWEAESDIFASTVHWDEETVWVEADRQEKLLVLKCKMIPKADFEMKYAAWLKD
jgi:hypothetical protein